MEPLIVKSAKVLVEVFQEKANSGKSLEAFRYVRNVGMLVSTLTFIALY